MMDFKIDPITSTNASGNLPIGHVLILESTMLSERLAVLERNAKSSTLGEQKQLVETLSRALTELRRGSDFDSSLVEEADDKRMELITQLQIKVPENLSVSLTLPAGTSRAEFIAQAHLIIKVGTGMNFVDRDNLATWLKTKAFTSKVSEDLEISVNGIHEESKGKSRKSILEIFEKQGLKMVSKPDLVVAHLAYYLATGADLFAGKISMVPGKEILEFGNGTPFHFPVTLRSYEFDEKASGIGACTYRKASQ